MSRVVKKIFFLVQISAICLLTTGAKQNIESHHAFKISEINFLDLKLKKELNDKKLSPKKKYLLAVLAARELKQLHRLDKALEFYQIAWDVKVDENKAEIILALTKPATASSTLFFFETDIKTLIKNKLYEKAILCLNPDLLNESKNAPYRILYDLINVKIKKRAVKKLYCFDDYQKNPEEYQYSSLLCDLLIDYLQDGKLKNNHMKEVEEYFLKHDLQEIYLLQIAKDLKI